MSEEKLSFLGQVMDLRARIGADPERKIALGPQWEPMEVYAMLFRVEQMLENPSVAARRQGEAVSERVVDEVCVGCGHSVSLHFNDVIGVARCLAVERGQTTRGVIGLPYEKRCDCRDFQQALRAGPPPQEPNEEQK